MEDEPDYVLLGPPPVEDWSTADVEPLMRAPPVGERSPAVSLRFLPPPSPTSLRPHPPTSPHGSVSRPTSPTIPDTTRNRLSTAGPGRTPEPTATVPHSRITIPPATPPRARSPSLRREPPGSYVVATLHFLRSLHASDLWLALFFTIAAGKSTQPIYNKALLRGFFPFPWLLTAVQMGCSSLGTLAAAKLGIYRASRLSNDRETVLYALSFLFSCEILASNVSLKLVAIPFHLSVRALAPVLTLLLSVLFFKQKTTLKTSSCLSLVVLGVLFTAHGLDRDSTGSILTVFSMFLASAKAIITRELLMERYQLHPLDLQSRMTTLGIVHCALFAWWNGELRRLWDGGADMSRNQFVAIGGNGVLSFALFIISLLAEKRTKSDSMAISSHAAQAVTTATSVVVWGLKLSPTNFIGVALTLGGGVLYARSDAVDTSPPEKDRGEKELPD